MPELTRHQVALAIGAAVAVLTLAVGIYGLLTGPEHERHDARNGSIEIDTGPVSSKGHLIEGDPTTSALPKTNDAIAYARAVATGLFDWDTASGYLPADYQWLVLADADPSGEETPGLIADVNTYFPTLDQWLDLATMEVSQTLTIDSAEVPASWQRVVDQTHGELRPGTTAVTISGTRERVGTWNGVRTTTSSPVVFTVFVACQPVFDRCYALRLSELGNPLK